MRLMLKTREQTGTPWAQAIEGVARNPQPLSHLRLRELPIHLQEERADSKSEEGSPARQAVPRGQGAGSCRDPAASRAA